MQKSPSNNSIFEQKTILTFITYEWDTAPWWAFKLNTVLAAAEKWHLEQMFVFAATQYGLKKKKCNSHIFTM